MIRIRQHYIRKIKFVSTNLNEKFSKILEQFPRTETIHPFYADLLNVLYDVHHYRLALGQLASLRNLVKKLEQDFIGMMKNGNTFYGCKQLKKAAFGRMCSIVKHTGTTLIFLEQVRQHMSRLPILDPNKRTFILCGSPNVGKSSFVDKVTHADVEIHPRSFTTKALFVGHMEYNFMTWQIIDTPGLLDRPFNDRKTIEMQTITALAHIRACILFIVDIAEQCGYTLEQQASLFKSLKPLVRNKPTLVICNKIDLIRPDKLTEKNRNIVLDMISKSFGDLNTEKIHQLTVTSKLLLSMSTLTEEGLASVRQIACELFLKSRMNREIEVQKLDRILGHVKKTKTLFKNSVSTAFIPTQIGRKTNERETRLALVEKKNALSTKATSLDNLSKNFSWNPVLREVDVLPQLLDGYTIANVIYEDIATKLASIEHQENQIFEDWKSLEKNVHHEVEPFLVE
jgi:nucleolar GTP-binding protein